MRHLAFPWLDVHVLIRTYYVIGLVVESLSQAMDVTRTTHPLTLDANSVSPSRMAATRGPFDSETEKDVLCCSGVLGFASDNVSLNFPCQNRPCCNSSETQAVVPVDMAMGFRFQCMPRSTIQPLCYQSGSEVRTSNQDPDFMPRACCPGLKFKVQLNQWYAALVVKCVEMTDDSS